VPSGVNPAVCPKLQAGFADSVEGAASAAGCSKEAVCPKPKLDLGFEVASFACESVTALVSPNLKVGAAVDVVEGAAVDVLPKLKAGAPELAD